MAYMDDMEKALTECRKALAEGREISDACARVIASMFHCGQGSASYSFASTGRISASEDWSSIVADRSNLWGQMFPDYTVLAPGERLLGDMMGTYLLTRVKSGVVGAVPGWSDLWL